MLSVIFEHTSQVPHEAIELLIFIMFYASWHTTPVLRKGKYTVKEQGSGISPFHNGIVYKIKRRPSTLSLPDAAFQRYLSDATGISAGVMTWT